jgi:hypothetical protein
MDGSSPFHVYGLSCAVKLNVEIARGNPGALIRSPKGAEFTITERNALSDSVFLAPETEKER